MIQPNPHVYSRLVSSYESFIQKKKVIRPFLNNQPFKLKVVRRRDGQLVIRQEASRPDSSAV